MEYINLDMTVVRGDEEFAIVVEFEIQPGRSGFTSGRPEDCYPDDDTEVEIVSSTILSQHGKEKHFELTQKEINELTQIAYEKWVNHLQYRR